MLKSVLQRLTNSEGVGPLKLHHFFFFFLLCNKNWIKHEYLKSPKLKYNQTVSVEAAMDWRGVPIFEASVSSVLELLELTQGTLPLLAPGEFSDKFFISKNTGFVLSQLVWRLVCCPIGLLRLELSGVDCGEGIGMELCAPGPEFRNLLVWTPLFLGGAGA